MSGPRKWAPITDLPEDANALTEGELRSLQRVWARQRVDLVEQGALDEFEKRLRREWSIETGIIENVYTLDRGVTRTLIEKGIDAALIPHDATNRDSTLVARIIQDHYDALDGMFDFVGGQRELTAGYVKELHAALLRNQETYHVVDQFGRAFEKELEKGVYKIAPNSPTRPDGVVHEYCPPEQVTSEMDRLIQMHVKHQIRGVPPEVEAAWLHHRFAQIHPFSDGNGRVARALASLVFIKANLFPLVVKRDDWSRYIEALENGDRGDLKPLVALFVDTQRTALWDATEVAFEAIPIDTVGAAIMAVRDRLMQRGRLPLQEWLAAKKTAKSLVAFASNRLQLIAEQLKRDIASLGRGFGFAVFSQEGDPELFDKRLAAIRDAGQIPDLDEFNTTVRLAIDTGHAERLVLSFHGIGPRFRGLIGVVPYYIQDQLATSLRAGAFHINYEEPLESAQARFSTWLERVIVAGLDQWRRTL
jgi:Fic family protein